MSKARDHYFDNAKFFLIVLVVFGHLLRSFISDNHFLEALYLFIYSFHMPAFVLISGYFAKGIHRPGYIMKVIKKLLIPYIIFQSFYAFYYYFIDDVNTINLNPFDPQWAMWFLLSLCSWQLLLYLFKDYNQLWLTTLSFVIGIGAGYFDFINGTMSLSRTLVFFPLFLLGYNIQKEHTQVIRNKKYVPYSIILLFIIFSFYFITDVDFGWLFGSQPYSSLEHVDVYSGFKRAAIYIVILMCTFSFLNLVPSRKLSFTYIGSRTMFIYLLHGLFIGLFRAQGWDDAIKGHLAAVLSASMALTIILVYSFSHDWTKRMATPLVEPSTND